MATRIDVIANNKGTLNYFDIYKTYRMNDHYSVINTLLSFNKCVSDVVGHWTTNNVS